MQHSAYDDVAPWFAAASPGLLTNRTIRNYLDGYTQRQWSHVVKLTLLHGIISLQKQYPGGSPCSSHGCLHARHGPCSGRQARLSLTLLPAGSHACWPARRPQASA